MWNVRRCYPRRLQRDILSRRQIYNTMCGVLQSCDGGLSDWGLYEAGVCDGGKGTVDSA